MATLFEAYVTNAGKYSEGQLVGETLKFPTTAQEVEALLKRIGVDGVRYQEIFITSFDGDVLGLYDHLSEYENLDELNHLACLLSELTSSELETLEAVLDSGDHCSSVRDIINLTQNLDCYGFYPGVSDEETLGRIYVDDLEMLDVPDQVKPYFDYEAYGRDACIHENGHFAPGGYVVKESDHFVEVYHGLQDIPKEHKVNESIGSFRSSVFIARCSSISFMPARASIAYLFISASFSPVKSPNSLNTATA